MREAMPSRAPIAWAVGLVMGAVLAASSGWISDQAMTYYDDQHPVWTDVEAKLESRDDEAAVVKMSGTRHRDKECRILRMDAQTRHERDGLIYAGIKRLDAPYSGQSRPAGRQLIGVFEVRPVRPGAMSVLFTTQHECSGRVVFGKLAEVKLQ